MRAKQRILINHIRLISGIILWGLVLTACHQPPAPKEVSPPEMVVDPDTLPECNIYGIQ